MLLKEAIKEVLMFWQIVTNLAKWAADFFTYFPIPTLF